MPARFVNIDRETPLLLPPDMRAWLPKDHMAHLIMDAVESLDLSSAKVNERGSGSEAYPPAMMLGLLIYCYATGTFGSRKIEKLTYENVAVRVLCGDHHPDHDSICTFRRKNRELLQSSFTQVLELAAHLKVLKVGDVTLALDGTKVLANASKHSAVSYGHACQQMMRLEEQVEELLAKAEAADSAPLEDGLTVPQEVARRQDRLSKLKEATAVIQARAKERHAEEMAAFEAKKKEREAKAKETGKKPRGPEPKPPQEGPRDRDQYNFTDPQSRMMKTAHGFGQSYNAQAAVEVESRLIVGQHVSDAPNDKKQLGPGLQAVDGVIQSVNAVLIDSGFYSEAAVAAAEAVAPQTQVAGPKIYAATGRVPHGRSVGQLERRDDPPEPEPGASAKERMQHRISTKVGRELYALRKQTVEPVFGIIKAAMGFRRFGLRGLENVGTEWTLVTLAYNLKRLFHLGVTFKTA